MVESLTYWHEEILKGCMSIVLPNNALSDGQYVPLLM